jgi:hypothetical protein
MMRLLTEDEAPAPGACPAIALSCLSLTRLGAAEPPAIPQSVRIIDVGSASLFDMYEQLVMAVSNKHKAVSALPRSPLIDTAHASPPSSRPSSKSSRRRTAPCDLSLSAAWALSPPLER